MLCRADGCVIKLPVTRARRCSADCRRRPELPGVPEINKCAIIAGATEGCRRLHKYRRQRLIKRAPDVSGVYGLHMRPLCLSPLLMC